MGITGARRGIAPWDFRALIEGDECPARVAGEARQDAEGRGTSYATSAYPGLAAGMLWQLG